MSIDPLQQLYQDSKQQTQVADGLKPRWPYRRKSAYGWGAGLATASVLVLISVLYLPVFEHPEMIQPQSSAPTLDTMDQTLESPTVAAKMAPAPMADARLEPTIATLKANHQEQQRVLESLEKEVEMMAGSMEMEEQADPFALPIDQRQAKTTHFGIEATFADGSLTAMAANIVQGEIKIDEQGLATFYHCKERYPLASHIDVTPGLYQVRLQQQQVEQILTPLDSLSDLCDDNPEP